MNSKLQGLYLDEIMVPKYARRSYLSLFGYHGTWIKLTLIILVFVCVWGGVFFVCFCFVVLILFLFCLFCFAFLFVFVFVFVLFFVVVLWFFFCFFFVCFFFVVFFFFFFGGGGGYTGKGQMFCGRIRLFKALQMVFPFAGARKTSCKFPQHC